jgi:hypothetical protein
MCAQPKALVALMAACKHMENLQNSEKIVSTICRKEEESRQS